MIDTLLDLPPAPSGGLVACSSCGGIRCECVLPYRGRYVALCQPCRDAVREERQAHEAAGGTLDAWIERLNAQEAQYLWYVKAEQEEQLTLFEETNA